MIAILDRAPNPVEIIEAPTLYRCLEEQLKVSWVSRIRISLLSNPAEASQALNLRVQGLGFRV